MTATQDTRSVTSKGALSAVSAYILWGVSSIYWHLLGQVPPVELLAYRIVMSLVVLVLALWFGGTLAETMNSARAPKNIVIYTFSALSIAVNWGAFMWGSIHGRVVETGLGYLIAPLVNVAFGVLFLREPFTKVKATAILIMVLAVLLIIVRSSELDFWVYFAISTSFGIYSILRKIGTLGAIQGLAVETTGLAAVVIVGAGLGMVPLGFPLIAPPGITTVLLACGVVSVVPLWLFSLANRALPLTMLGFLQYVLPSTQFVLAVWYFKQIPSMNTVVSLCLIWTALAIVLTETAMKHRKVDAALSPARS